MSLLAEPISKWYSRYSSLTKLKTWHFPTRMAEKRMNFARTAHQSISLFSKDAVTSLKWVQTPISNLSITSCYQPVSITYSRCAFSVLFSKTYHRCKKKSTPHMLIHSKQTCRLSLTYSHLSITKLKDSQENNHLSDRITSRNIVFKTGICRFSSLTTTVKEAWYLLNHWNLTSKQFYPSRKDPNK